MEKRSAGDSPRHKPGSRKRSLPTSGSASQLKQLRTRKEPLPVLMERLQPDQLAGEILKTRRLIYGGTAIVFLGMVVWGAAQIFHWTQVAYYTKFALFAFPVCLAFGLNDICTQIARRRPELAQQILSMFNLGNAHAVMRLADLYVDTGDYQKAEKVLKGAAQGTDPKRKLRDYILLHAYLANMRAHIGRLTEGQQTIKQVLTAAEDHYADTPTDKAAFLLAGTLNYAAQVCDLGDKMQDALALSKRSVELVCSYTNPPCDLVLTSLYTAGYFSNVMGEYQEALLYSTRANEIISKTGCPRDSLAAGILSNLGIANLGLGRGTVCKRFLTDAQTRALEPLGQKERPTVYQALAIFHFANSRLEESLVAYEAAIDACQYLKPRESVQVLRIFREYTVLLKEVGKKEKALEREDEVNQIQQKLTQINHKALNKKDQLKPVSVPAQKSRIPIFWMAFAVFEAWQVWENGLRVAPFSNWLFLMTAITVVIIKLRAMYGPPVKEETSQGAVLAVVSLIPGLRSIVPELARTPKMMVSVVLGVAATILILAKVTAPAPNTVPESGLLAHEYFVLGLEDVGTESLNNARAAFKKAAAADPNGDIGKNARLNLESLVPWNNQPEKAIQDNMDALEKSKSDKKEAMKLWRRCTRKYPNFEWPYTHIAELLAEDKKYDEAEEEVNKALEINENCGPALMVLHDIKRGQDDSEASTQALAKYMRVTSLGSSPILGFLTNTFEKAADDPELKQKRKARKHKKTQPAKEESDDFSDDTESSGMAEETTARSKKLQTGKTASDDDFDKGDTTSSSSAKKAGSKTSQKDSAKSTSAAGSTANEKASSSSSKPALSSSKSSDSSKSHSSSKFMTPTATGGDDDEETVETHSSKPRKKGPVTDTMTDW